MYLKLAWRNIWRNKRRTIITLMSIAFAVFFASVMQSMQLGTYANMISNSVRFYTGYAQIHKTGYWEERSLDNSFSLPENVEKALMASESIVTIVPRIESFSLVSFGEKAKGAMLIGIDPFKENELTSLKEKLVQGQYLTENGNSLIIGKGLAEYLNVQVGDTLAPELSLIVEQSGTNIYILVIIFMTALIFGIINTMLMAVLERIKELGMLMAIGMNKLRLFFMITIETVYLGLVACPAVLFLGYLTINYFHRFGLDLSAYAEGLQKVGYEAVIYPIISGNHSFILSLGIFITTIIASIYPSLKAIKLKPAEALRKV